MAKGSKRKEDRLVLLSDLAELDLSEIHTYTTYAHGPRQADDYLEFLVSAMISILAEPGASQEIVERPGRQILVAKWKGAMHGHRIVFEQIPQGIYVVRILHSAMDLGRHLGE